MADLSLESTTRLIEELKSRFDVLLVIGHRTHEVKIEQHDDHTHENRNEEIIREGKGDSLQLLGAASAATEFANMLYDRWMYSPGEDEEDKK